MPPCLANFVFLVETVFLHVGQAGLELPTTGDPSASASQSAGSTGVSHCAQPYSSFFLIQGLTLSPRWLECSGVVWILDHCSLNFLGSSDPPTSASQEVGTRDVCYRIWLIFYFVEMGFCHVAQTCLELLDSSNPPASASQSAGITGVSQSQSL